MLPLNAYAAESVAALLKNLDLDSALANSCANFHQKGFHYINLVRTPEYTAKLYFGLPGEVQANVEGNVVNPHSHGYQFRQTVLRGTLENILMHPVGSAEKNEQPLTEEMTWWGADYLSGFKTGDGRPSLAWDREPQRIGASVHRYYPGSGYFMNIGEIHTIRIVPGPQPLVLFSEQYADENLPCTRYFAREREDPDMTGLYTPMTREHASALLATLPFLPPL